MPILPSLLLLFVGSGMAALIYEVVWQQLLQLVIGSSTVSLGILLATFMGGMCAGSLCAPRLVSWRRHPLRVYAVLEAAIGTAGLVLLAVMPMITRVYVAAGDLGTAGVIVRAAVAGICLVPPTGAMGATLPVIARWIDGKADARAWLGFFYAGNLAGAVLGCTAAGFYLLRVFDMAVATYVAAAINAVVAAVAWTVSRRTEWTPQSQRDDAMVGLGAVDMDRGRIRRVYLAIALSGFCALAAEVVWTRTLALAFGATVYTFAIILAVFLVGLGLGSSAGAALGRRVRDASMALGWAQVGAATAIAWSAYVLADVLPFWRNADAATAMSALFVSDLLKGAYAILPAPLMWGASFALALQAAGRDDAETDAVVGRLYAANTAGAIAGALIASFVLVQWIGSQHTQQVMEAVALLSAVVMFTSAHAPRRSRMVALSASAASLLLLAFVPRVPALLVAYGRHAAAWTSYADKIVYVGEGMHASVAVSRNDNGVLNYHNAGKVQASSEPADMRLQRMLGHLTTLLPARPRSVLVIGCGAGVTAGAVSVSPAVDQVTIVEIEPLVPRVAERYFGPVNHDVLRNPKVRVVSDDARHFLQTTKLTFDAITSDPLDPWVKGAATLYTREFFETARQHLNPGGVMTLYVQLFESSPAAVKSEMATFFQAFPDGLVFGNTFEGHAIDTVLVGPTGPQQIWVDETESLLRQPAFAPVDGSLMQAGLYGAVDLFGNYAGRASDLRGWLADAQINHDRDLRLQYLAGLGLNQHVGEEIYREMLAYRTYPDDLFVASDSTVGKLKAAMAGERE
jgi:spermidine synthase